MDEKIWEHLPQDLVERCFGHLPVLTIASTMRQVNTRWRDFPGSARFMALHNHGMNIDSSFGFLICGTNTVSRQCETMVLDHNTLKWQQAPSLQQQLDSNCNYHVESISEGILLLRLYEASFPSLKRLIVWNPMLPLSCKKTIPYMPENFWSVNLVVNKEDGSFKILAFSLRFRECCIYSSTANLWLLSIDDYQGPSDLYAHVSFPTNTYGDHITVSYKDCLYVAVELPRNDDLRHTHQVGVVCYDVNTNVWKPAALFTLPLEIMNRYGLIHIGFTTITKAFFVISDVMYMVIEYASRSPDASSSYSANFGQKHGLCKQYR